MRDLHLLFPREEESWNSFGQRLAEAEGQVIAVLAGTEDRLLKDQGGTQTIPHGRAENPQPSPLRDET